MCNSLTAWLNTLALERFSVHITHANAISHGRIYDLVWQALYIRTYKLFHQNTDLTYLLVKNL